MVWWWQWQPIHLHHRPLPPEPLHATHAVHKRLDRLSELRGHLRRQQPLVEDSGGVFGAYYIYSASLGDYAQIAAVQLAAGAAAGAVAKALPPLNGHAKKAAYCEAHAYVGDAYAEAIDAAVAKNAARPAQKAAAALLAAEKMLKID